MEKILDQSFTGERALYDIHDKEIVSCRFYDGESPLKECSSLVIDNCSFEWKYPLWYGHDFLVKNSKFEVMSRSGIWYTHGIAIFDSVLDCPKTFRRSSNIILKNVKMNDAGESFWNCSNINIENVQAEKGDYIFFNCEIVKVKNFVLNGNYAFDGASFVEATDSTFNSKDSFWNCKHALVKNCTIVGEYIGWNSEDLTFIDCSIESEQGFCYIKGLKLVNCTLKGVNLSFELCEDIDVEVKGHIDSIKNPISGRIVCDSVGEIIFNRDDIDPSRTEIIVGGKRYEI